MAEFETLAEGRFLLRFESDEATLLRRLFREMESLLSHPGDNEPVVERLFPDAYSDPADQTAYQELVGDQLRDEKLRALRSVSTSLADDEVTLALDDMHLWLAVINDLRLAIGTRLDVTEEVMAGDLDPEDPDSPLLSVLHWLGWVQESILNEMS